jgi:hypothetical protein
MYYLELACQIQTTAQAGSSLTTPPPDVRELAARQLTGSDSESNLRDDVGYDLAWAALLRLLDRVAPDYRDGATPA